MTTKSTVQYNIVLSSRGEGNRRETKEKRKKMGLGNEMKWVYQSLFRKKEKMEWRERKEDGGLCSFWKEKKEKKEIGENAMTIIRYIYIYIYRYRSCWYVVVYELIKKRETQKREPREKREWVNDTTDNINTHTTIQIYNDHTHTQQSE